MQGEDYIYPKSKAISYRYICECDCGRVKLVHKSHLLNGSSQSCGCLSKEISSTHGMSKTRAYKSWSNMVRRCSGVGGVGDKSYVDKGISVDSAWLTFEAFYADMGDCPDGFELERKDIAGNYCQDNCTWTDEVTQATNRGKFSNNTSGYTGVIWSKAHSAWRVVIQVNNQRHEGGLYSSFEEAVVSRQKLELKHLGYVKEYGND